MSSVSCTPEQYRVQYRVQGTSLWSTKNAVILITVVHLIKQVDCLLTYYQLQHMNRMKAWYCFTSGASTWTSIHTFTTLDLCPNVATLQLVHQLQQERHSLGMIVMVRTYSFVVLSLE